ncbi:hypothetical protein [Nocardia arthritidis]|uniref:Uncharacterized protein n=1 Tax=Nocardia arthritidis TaxID=228602 RepID=A0A6G9YTG6_9NOCA|nr:hypothetical protein [Nocardia arthritidis]QIS16508.1 hypothetical protein F5544_43520 [Nocardia arthritidis]
MSYPVGPAPDGAWKLGGRYGQDIEKDAVPAIVTNGAKTKWSDAQAAHKTNVRDRIDSTYTIAVSANGSADKAVTTAQAAANAAANAQEKASTAYENASYWILECVVASAEVLLGVNELLLGPVLNVPSNRKAVLTDVHIALLEQPNGMSLEIRKWNAPGTQPTTVTTVTLDPKVTRRNIALPSVPVLDKERFYYYVTSVTGSIPPQVLQVAVAGAYL